MIDNYEELVTPPKTSTAGNHVVYGTATTGVVHVKLKTAMKRRFPQRYLLSVFLEWGAICFCHLQQKAEMLQQ